MTTIGEQLYQPEGTPDDFQAELEREEQLSVRTFRPNPKRDWTYSQGCGCQVTFFAESDWHTSRMTPGKYCTLHTARHQEAARDAFIAEGKASLAEYRHVTETVGNRYLMAKAHGGKDLYAIVDGEHASGFMPLFQALCVAQVRFGRVILNVWDCDLMTWQSEMVADPCY